MSYRRLDPDPTPHRAGAAFMLWCSTKPIGHYNRKLVLYPGQRTRYLDPGKIYPRKCYELL